SHRTGDLNRVLQVNGWAPLPSARRDASIMLLPLMSGDLAANLRNMEIASRNISGVSMMNAADAEVYEILRHDYLIMDRNALDLLQSILKPM
ncbi:hypothetical protein J3F82_006185, partial [Coemansia sp. RSA 637]